MSWFRVMCTHIGCLANAQIPNSWRYRDTFSESQHVFIYIGYNCHVSLGGWTTYLKNIAYTVLLAHFPQIERKTMFDFDTTPLYFPTFVRTELSSRDIPGWYARWHLVLSQDVGWCVPDISYSHPWLEKSSNGWTTKPELKQDTPRPVETKSPILFTGRPRDLILGQVFSFWSRNWFLETDQMPLPQSLPLAGHACMILIKRSAFLLKIIECRPAKLITVGCFQK